MTDIRSLEQTLLENLPWNKARIKFVARFLLALYAVQTVNLSILATAFSGPAQRGVELQTTPTLPPAVRDALRRTRRVRRQIARPAGALHAGVGSDELESRRR